MGRSVRPLGINRFTPTTIGNVSPRNPAGSSGTVRASSQFYSGWQHSGAPRAKGQVTLRKDLLEHLGVRPGEKITIDKLPDGRIEVRAARPTGKISEAFNFLKKENGPLLSVEEMSEIAARGWAGKR
jgi:hypothetical protein